jgi:hypothetical protein
MNEDVNPQEMTPDEAAASMGLATRLQDELLASQNPQMGMEEPMAEQPMEQAQETPQDETPQEDTQPNIQEEVKKDFEGFKDEVRGMIDEKIGDLTKTIKDALKE